MPTLAASKWPLVPTNLAVLYSYCEAVTQRSPGSRYSAHPGSMGEKRKHLPRRRCTAWQSNVEPLRGSGKTGTRPCPRVRGVPRPWAELFNAFSVSRRRLPKMCTYRWKWADCFDSAWVRPLFEHAVTGNSAFGDFPSLFSCGWRVGQLLLVFSWARYSVPRLEGPIHGPARPSE